MANLPAAFIEYTRQLMGEERFGRYLKSFEEEPPVSIRLNPKKLNSQRHTLTLVREDGRWQMDDAEPVPWCRNGYYLKKRPNFTFDPLFHAGCYYVQEAASMFLDEVLKQVVVIAPLCHILQEDAGPIANGLVGVEHAVVGQSRTE